MRARTNESSQVKVWWYRTFTQSFNKSCYLKGLKLLTTEACYYLPTNQNDLFNQSSVVMLFSISISTKNMFCLRSERYSVICSIWCLWNQSNRSPIFSSLFCQGIVYDITIHVPWHHRRLGQVYFSCYVLSRKSFMRAPCLFLVFCKSDNLLHVIRFAKYMCTTI